MVKTWSIVHVVVVAAGVLGCNSIVGIEEPVEQGAIPKPASQDGSARPEKEAGAANDVAVARFVGTWRATPVKTVTCGTMSGTPQEDPFVLTIRRGIQTDLEAGTPGCKLLLNVKKDTATIAAPATCSVTFATGEINTYTYKTGALVIDPAGTTGVATLGGDVSVDLPDGKHGDCTFTEVDPFTKTS